MNNFFQSFDTLTFEEIKTAENVHENKEEFRSKNFESKRSKQTLINEKFDGNLEKENDETQGEFYGQPIHKFKDIFVDLKEKKINDFLDFEKVDWGDPIENSLNYYNKKKIMLKKKYVSCNSASNKVSANEINIEASPLLMRRKNKCNTLSPVFYRFKLKEVFSEDEFSPKEKTCINIHSTKFKNEN